ncbi:MAG: glutaredoxin family protein [Verrucomicrobiota bacterium]|jgi:glutaredoxin
MILYIKRGCPWCVFAEAWLKQHAVTYTPLDVLSDAVAFAEMRRLSGQTKAPVLITDNGQILADFGPEELPGFLKIPN